jgi:pyridoxal phosphate enzyme (YggS family)
MIAENVKNIRESIAATCYRIGRDPQTVDLIAVSKTFGADAVTVAYEAGIRDFGENYVQELVGKREHLIGSDIHWHFIGHLQTNKVKYIIEWVKLIQSVDSKELAAEIEKRGSRSGKIIDVLIEVNTSEEATKFGVKPPLAMDLIRTVNDLPSLRLKGLMTIGPFSDIAEESRVSFRSLKNIFEQANGAGFLRTPMTVLSMGMTHDYPIAIEEGSTMVRVGTAIFGTRKKRD